MQFAKFSTKTPFVTIFSKCLEKGKNFLQIFAQESKTTWQNMQMIQGTLEIYRILEGEIDTALVGKIQF